MVRSAKAVVLVVEDEPVLRMHASDILTEAGFDTVEAGTADDAVSILKARTDIRLVFTDIDMPGSMDGLKLAAVIRDRWPPIEIIITSGHRSPEAADMPHRSVFFSKPISEKRLVTAVRAFVNVSPP